MADQVTIDSGSPQRVALDLARQIWAMEHSGKSFPTEARKPFLDLFAECLEASRGVREIS